MVAYMLMTELEDARQRRLLTWGVILLLVNLGTVLLAIWLQVTEANRQIVLQLMLLEREIRDADGFMRNFVSDTIAAFQDAGARLAAEVKAETQK